VTPAIRIERGQPTDDELAALVAALASALMTRGHQAAVSAGAARRWVGSARPRRWVDSARPRADRLPRPGPNAWRRSALPSPP
jgi:hypothetical protein